MTVTTRKPVVKALYRNLLRTAKPFTTPRHGPVLSSLLFRSRLDDYSRLMPLFDSMNVSHFNDRKEIEGNDDEKEEEAEAMKLIHIPREQARDLTKSYDELRRLHYQRNKVPNIKSRLSQRQQQHLDDNDDDSSIPLELTPHKERALEHFENEENFLHSNRTVPPWHIILYKQMLEEVIGKNVSMTFPSQILASSDNVMNRMKTVIRREFRNDCESLQYRVRLTTAFLALRELNKKLACANWLGFRTEEEQLSRYQKQTRRRKLQAARDVTLLPTLPASEYLRPGAFLVAHPFLTGYFSRSVIAILNHIDPGGDESCRRSSGGGTYGLVINRGSLVNISNEGFSKRKRNRTLREIIRADCLPEGLKEAFGDLQIREGGPLNFCLQMLHTASALQEENLRIGGIVLPMISKEKSTAMNSDAAIYYQGDIIKAAQAVIDGELDRDEFSFLVGACSWDVGQLEDEVAKGYWLPCAGPPQMALTGMCEHVNDNDDDDNELSSPKNDPSIRPKSDLWLSVMCALGEGEAELAHMLLDEVEYDDNREACDNV